jgi:hypothetical protein
MTHEPNTCAHAFTWHAVIPPSHCPHCGRCLTCRGQQQPATLPTYPAWPTTPYPYTQPVYPSGTAAQPTRYTFTTNTSGAQPTH